MPAARSTARIRKPAKSHAASNASAPLTSGPPRWPSSGPLARGPEQCPRVLHLGRLLISRSEGTGRLQRGVELGLGRRPVHLPANLGMPGEDRYPVIGNSEKPAADRDHHFPALGFVADLGIEAVSYTHLRAHETRHD